MKKYVLVIALLLALVATPAFGASSPLLFGKAGHRPWHKNTTVGVVAPRVRVVDVVSATLPVGTPVEFVAYGRGMRVLHHCNLVVTIHGPVPGGATFAVPPVLYRTLSGHVIHWR